MSVGAADMAKAAAVIGLISSIASIVDLSAKVVFWVHEFAFKISDISEFFRSLSIRLFLLKASLERITI